MTPEGVAELVARWVRFYTRNLSTPIARRRVNEIEADLHDHIAHERAHGTSDRRIAFSILSRMVRGLASDVSWRGHQVKATTGHPSTSEEAMRKHKTVSRSAARVALATAVILLLPLLAMQFTDEVVWGPVDFVVVGALLFGTGLAYQLAARKADAIPYRAAVGIALAAALLLIWINLAVGIIGSEDNPANWMYGGVLAVGMIGAILARFRPHGMARALLAASLAQALVAVIALIFGLGSPESRPLQIAALNGFFVALFVGSAWLFRHSARQLPARRTHA
jgi:hypothetical protein